MLSEMRCIRWEWRLKKLDESSLAMRYVGWDGNCDIGAEVSSSF